MRNKTPKSNNIDKDNVVGKDPEKFEQSKKKNLLIGDEEISGLAEGDLTDKEGIISNPSPADVELKIEKKKTVVFKQNRKFELKVGREVLVWFPNGKNPEYCINEQDKNNDVKKYRNGLPSKILDHPSFKSHIKYFSIKD